jgi:hypothetical protein
MLENALPLNVHAQLLRMGMNVAAINRHMAYVHKVIDQKSFQNHFKVLDTCRLDNKRLRPANWLSPASGKTFLQDYAAFVPAAGVGSRYLQPLAKVTDISRYQHLLPRDFQAKPNRAKALYPCHSDGHTFLQQKVQEHTQIGLKHQFFICPQGQQDTFRDHLGNDPMITLYEQDQRLSTLRIDAHGNPCFDEKGRASYVPAGHGSLIQLFPKVRAHDPRIKSLFIRNIDNVSALNTETSERMQRFLHQHHQLLSFVKQVRHLLSHEQIDQASDTCQPWLSMLDQRPYSDQEAHFLRHQPEGLKVLWSLQFQLFQTPVPKNHDHSLTALSHLYSRPVNLMGQVANTGTDQGGSPVIIDCKGQRLSICLEIPHANPSDQKAYLLNKAKATHFNPAFVAAELPDNPHYYSDTDNPFWLVVEKLWQGKKVYYYETVLYELLSSSLATNTVFVDVPRSLFNPHKSIDDTLKQHPAPSC